MRLVEYDSDDLGQMTVPSDTGRWYRYIDMLDRLIDLFIQHAYRGGGHLSSRKRESHFSFLIDDDLAGLDYQRSRYFILP